MTRQSHFASMVESVANVFVGFAINLTCQMLVYPVFGFHPSIWVQVKIGLIFTIVSVARSFGVRRFFNLLHHKDLLP